MGLLIGLLLAATPGPDPARLVNVRYSEAGDVGRVRAATWHPSDPRNGGRSVLFTAPGRMVLDWRTDGAFCSFTSRRRGGGWALLVDCGSGPSPARWAWLPGGGVRTSVFQLAAPQMSEAEVELSRFDLGFAEVEKEYRAGYRQASLRKLAGRWEDASGSAEVVLDPRHPALGGRPAEVQAEPCLPLAAPPGAAGVICLSVSAGDERLLLAEQGERLFECTWDESAEGAVFDLAQGSRIFTRTSPRP